MATLTIQLVKLRTKNSIRYVPDLFPNPYTTKKRGLATRDYTYMLSCSSCRPPILPPPMKCITRHTKSSVNITTNTATPFSTNGSSWLSGITTKEANNSVTTRHIRAATRGNTFSHVIPISAHVTKCACAGFRNTKIFQ